MVTINRANVKHVNSKKNQFLHHGRLAPSRLDTQLMAALSRQYKIVSAFVKGDKLTVHVDDKVEVCGN